MYIHTPTKFELSKMDLGVEELLH